MVATNVATEKSSRAMEVLVTSAKPTSMMFGKVLASCIAGFSQLVLVFGTAILLYNVNKEALSNPLIASIFDIPIELFIYLIVFFDNTAMLVCSYIPFTSPMAMFTRICMSTVAW